MKFNIKKVVIWLLGIMIGSFMIAGIAFVATGGKKIASVVRESINEEKTFSANGIKVLEITGVSEQIKIIPVEEKSIKVHYYGDISVSDKKLIPILDANIKDNRLIIKIVNKPQVGFNIKFTGSTFLDVYVPKEYKDDISVNTVSGNFDIRNMNINNLQHKSVSGSLDCKDINVATAKTETISGNIIFNGFMGDVDFKSVSGDMLLVYSAFSNNIKIKTTSGHARVKLPQDAQFNLKSQSVSGEVTTQFPMTVTNNNRRKFEGSVGNSSNTITVETVSGNVDIEK